MIPIDFSVISQGDGALLNKELVLRNTETKFVTFLYIKFLRAKMNPKMSISYLQMLRAYYMWYILVP